MQQLCTRCARKTLLTESGRGHRIFSRVDRSFSTSMLALNDSSDKSMGLGSAQPAPPRQLLIRRELVDSPSGRRPPPGQILRRTGPPRNNAGARSGPGQRGWPGQAQGGSQSRVQQRRRSRRSDEEEEQGVADIDNATFTKIYDPPDLPTTMLPYNPKEPTLEDLRVDWPATAASATGLVEGVQQKLEWLARRLPHGYQSPEFLAERYNKGEMIRVESAEEKEKIIKIAGELAKKRADMLTDRQGVEFKPDDMSFSAISATEQAGLAAEMVKGVYPGVEKQRMPFMDTIARNLRNNQTYQGVEMGQFMHKIESLLPKPKAAPKAAKAK